MNVLRRRRALLPLVAVLLAGCVSIPTSGPVEQRGEAARGQVQLPVINLLAQPPQPGMSQLEIVRGFLEASAALDEDSAGARAYLSPEAVAAWDPTARVTVYSQPEGTDLLTTSGATEVQLRAPQTATISSRGAYLVSDPEATITQTFGLQRVDGEWRIDELEDGLLLTSLDVTRSYRAFDLFFLDPTGQRLVPDTLLLASSSSVVASVLARSLLSGPTEWLAPAVDTAFPAGTQLAVPSVAVVDGVARVVLTDQVLRVPVSQVNVMLAQLAQTLFQLPNITSIDVTASGQPLPGAPIQVLRDTYESYDPDGPVGLPVASSEGRVVVVGDPTTSSIAGALGVPGQELIAPAIAFDESYAAALSRDRSTLYVGSTQVGTPAAVVLEGRRQLTAPSWDPSRRVWVAGTTKDGPRGWSYTPDGTPRRVDFADLVGGSVTAMRLSRDGVRVALVRQIDGQRSLLVGRIVDSGAQVRIEGLRRLETSLVDVLDVAWADSTHLMAIGALQEDSYSVLDVGFDGTVESPATTAPAGMLTITASPAQPVLLGTKVGQLWRKAPVGWSLIGEGRDPSYPG